jgi:hypothetical protein
MNQTLAYTVVPQYCAVQCFKTFRDQPLIFLNPARIFQCSDGYNMAQKPILQRKSHEASAKGLTWPLERVSAVQLTCITYDVVILAKRIF